MKTLLEIFQQNNDKPIHKWLHYFDVYERHLLKYRNKPVKVLEIGVQGGGSLQMWKQYFGSNSKILGIDIDESCKFEEDQISVEIGSQADENFLRRIAQEYGPFDIIIDDGSHIQSDVLNSFFFLYSFLNRDGCYIIEDTHTAYFRAFQGGLRSEANSVSVLSNFVHDINAEYMEEPFGQTLRDISSMCFYDSMIVIEKEKQKDRYVMKLSKDEKTIQSGKDFF